MPDLTPRPCLTPGCTRAARPDWAWCLDCSNRVMDNALGRPVRPMPTPQSWHDRARAEVGRTSVVGGVAA